MNNIEFVKTERRCGHNESVQAGGAGKIIYDYEVWIDGDYRAEFNRRHGKGYNLRTAGRHYKSIMEHIEGRRRPEYVEVKSKAQFLPTIERLLAAGLIPTTEQNRQHDAEVEKAKAAREEKDRLARIECAFESRLVANGRELIAAAKNAADSMRNMRQGTFRGATARIDRIIKLIEENETV